MSTRLGVNVNDQTAAQIRLLQARQQTTATEVIRRAIAAYTYICAAQDRGERVEFTDGNTVREVRFL